ncbi:MAG: NupC/NupG family nucleoside CNT transporter [Calditrichaeota bacterium]|nr:MAG: NupC/NupG family nucleoside CNT transporter [Calditrichota bacterium]
MDFAQLQGILGLFVFVGIAYAISTDRKSVNWRTVGGGIGLQIFFAIIVLKTEFGKSFFEQISYGVTKLLNFTAEGSSFVFGSLAGGNDSIGFVFAFMVLPTIIFFSAFMSVLYHLNIMQFIVKGMAWVMKRTMQISGAESIAVAANTFVGQTEAPLVVKPYVGKMTTSELMALMTGGFATIAGGVLAAYILFLGGDDPIKQLEFTKHLLAASLMSAPAALVMAKIMIPETEQSSFTDDGDGFHFEKSTTNVIDAAASGAADGLQLALNVGAMLLAFIALIALANYPLEILGGWIGVPDLSLTKIFGYVFSIFAFVIGAPWSESIELGGLLGVKVAVNEFVAYAELGKLGSTGVISERTEIIGTYALCGFANFSSIAIQIGGIGGIAPERKKDLAKIGLKAMIGGAFASWMTASIAGVLI